jgi:hypothetical protein
MPVMRVSLSSAVYGTIAVGALLAAETAQRENYAETIGALALTIVLYWIAHAYASSATRRLREQEHLTAKGFAKAMVEQAPILAGALAPLVMLVIFAIAGASLGHAVTAGIWTAAATIAGIEVTAALRAGAEGFELLAQIAIGVLLGLLVIALKLILH